MAAVFTDANFKQEVLDNKNNVTLIDFWAEWCGPCKQMGPIVEELAADFAGKAVVGKMDVDANSETPFNYRISGIPAFLIFKNGELVKKVVGMTTKQSLANELTAQLG